MALNGVVTTTAYDGRYLKLNWSATQSIEDNKSIITWELVGAGSTKYGYYTSGAFKVVIGGITVLEKDTDYRIDLYEGTEVASGTVDIAHNADGTKAISIIVEAAIYERYVNKSGSGTFTLDAIPRGALITSAPNFTDEENPTINYSNVLGDSVTSLQACITLDGTNADIAYRDISKTGSSYTFVLKDKEREVLRNATTTSNSRKVIFKIKSVVNGNTFTSMIEKTLTIVNALPLLNPTVEDINPNTLLLSGDKSRFIRYYSNADIKFNTTAQKGASIVSKKVVCGGDTLTADGTMSAVESSNFTFTVEDSRGNKTIKTVIVNMVGYNRLTCNLTNATAELADDNTTTINVTAEGIYFDGSLGTQYNELNVGIRYKINGGEWSGIMPINRVIDEYKYTATGSITGLDYTKTYIIEVLAQDSVFNVYGNYAKSEQKTLSTIPVFDWSKDDFNFNVPIRQNGAEVLRHTAGGNSVLGAVNEIYLRPSGFNSTTGEVRIKNDGSIITSKAIPVGSGGTGVDNMADLQTALGIKMAGGSSHPIYMTSNGMKQCSGTTMYLQNNTITTSGSTNQQITVQGTIVAVFITMRGADSTKAMNMTVNAAQPHGGSGFCEYYNYGLLNNVSAAEAWAMVARIYENTVNIYRAGGGTAAITCYVTTLYIPY